MKELAADGIPVAVSCRVLKLSRPPYYRWLIEAFTTAERTEAVRANALFDAPVMTRSSGTDFSLMRPKLLARA